MGQPVTTNPLLIMFINMTVVFAVLYGLSLIIRLIKVIDPTTKKRSVVDTPQSAPVPVVQATAPDNQEADDDIAVVIAAAVAALGYSVVSVASVHPAVSRAWRQAGRLEGIGNNLRKLERQSERR